MAQREFSRYQQKVIQRFYDNREHFDYERLSELVASLYLAEGKKREKLWKSAEEIMQRMNLPASRVAHVIKSADPTVLAEVVKDLQSGALQPTQKKPDAPAPGAKSDE